MDSVDDVALKKKTEDYWDRLTDNYKTPWLVWRSYVEELLPLEMLNLLTRTESSLKFELTKNAPTLDDVWPGCQLTLRTLQVLRNATVHTYLPIPKMMADEALKLAHLNLKDYCERYYPGPDIKPEVAAMPWPRLCQLCGVDQFLPPNLLKEVPDEVSTGC